MFDAHCHLTDPRVCDAASLHLGRARAAGVRGFALAGVDLADWKAQAALCQVNRDVFPVYGLHPQVVGELSRNDALLQLDALSGLLEGPEPPVALGELGLDRVVAPSETLALQEECFRIQLALARDLDLPVVLHVLGAQEAALRICESDGVPRRGGMVHSYSGSAELVPRWVKLGLHLSFSGSVTWHRARRSVLAAKATPAHRLLVETDSPDQTPEPHRPGTNEPAFLPAIVRGVALARGVAWEEVAELTEQNARALFGVSPA
jgi:TatD DNase family protein